MIVNDYFHFKFLYSALALTFENGKTYKYKYETKVSFGESETRAGSVKTVGYQLTTEFDLTPVFQAGDVQLLKIQVTLGIAIVRQTYYCKRGNFRVGVIFAFFAILLFSRKLPPRENKTHLPL